MQKRKASLCAIWEGVQMLIPTTIFTGDEDIILRAVKLTGDPLDELLNSDLAKSGTYEFTIIQGDQQLREFSEPIQLIFTVDQSADSENLRVYHWMPAETTWIPLESQSMNDYVSTWTTHFSIFTVFDIDDLVDKSDQEGENGTDKKETPLPKTATMIYIWVFIGLLLLFIGMVLFLVRRDKLKQ